MLKGLNILALGVVSPRKPVDTDSFLWPAIQELLRLLVGVWAFDAMTSTIFALRAFLILVFSDMPAIAMIMWMKNHNAIFPSRVCRISSLRVPDSRATAHSHLTSPVIPTSEHHRQQSKYLMLTIYQFHWVQGSILLCTVSLKYCKSIQNNWIIISCTVFRMYDS